MTINETVVYTLVGRDQLSKTFEGASKSAKLLAGGIALAGVALLKIGSDFDNAYDTIRTGTGKTGKALEGLKGDFKNVVKDVPADFGSASKAVSELNVRTGLTGKPLQVMSKQFLELSRITGTDVSQNISSVTRLFGDWSIKTGDQSKAMDSLFRASQSTGIGVNDLATQIVQFGAPLRQLGFGFEESAALMGKWEKEGVNAGLVLSGLKQGLGSFAKAGKDPAKALQEITDRIKGAGTTAEANKLAIETFGKRAGPDMAAAVREGRFDLKKLLDTVKGGRETILGAAEDTKDFTEKLLELKNKVFVVLEPVALAVFDGIGAGIDGVTAAVGALKSTWDDMPQWLQIGIAAWAGAVTASLAVVQVMGTAKTAILAVKSAAETAYLKFLLLSKGAKILTVSLGGIGVLLAAAAVAVEIFGGESEEAKQKVQAHTDALHEQTGALTDNNRALAHAALEEEGHAEVAERAGISQKLLTDAALGTKGAMERLAKAVKAANDEGRIGSGEALFLLQAVQAESEAVDESRGAWKRKTEAQGKDTEASKKNKEATDKQVKSLKDLLAIQQELAGKVLDAREAQRRYQESVDAARESLKKNGKTLDRTTEKGRANEEALDAMAKAALDQAEAMRKNGTRQDVVRGKISKAREEFIRTATQMGLSKEAARKLADKLRLIPGKYKADIHANTKPATDKIEALVRKFRNRIINLVPDSSGVVRDVGGAVLRAKGGSIPGWMGTRGRDSVPALLMPDEHVWTTEEVAKFGGHGEMERFRAMVRAGSVPRFAQGGPVTVPVNANLAGTAAKLNAILQAFSGGPTSAGLNGALAWARSQAGKPYHWGGVGPAGYDCSGFMSAITNVIRGKNPYSRLGSTGTFPWGGFSSGVGPFMIGSVRNAGGGIGHMAGTLNGVNVESRGGVGVIIGPSARGARDSLFTGPYKLGRYALGGRVGDPPFDLIDPRGKYAKLSLGQFDTGGYLMPGWNLAYNGIGRPERVIGPNDSAGNHYHVTVNVGGVVGMTKQELQNEFMKTLVSLEKQGRVKVS